MVQRYFEDFPPGAVFELGSRSVSEAAIIAFATEYDPQYFHTDPARAEGSLFGGLVASGWHTCCIFMRLLVDGLLRDSASLASPGIDEIRWPRPVWPGDSLSGRITILQATPSKRHADRGTLTHFGELRNQRQELVLSLRGVSILGRRPAAEAE